NAFPDVVLRIAEVPPATYSGLRERTHDLLLEWCVSPFSHDNDIKVELLFNDALVVVAGPHTRWARRRKIDLAELVDERWILGAPNTANYVDIVEAFATRGLAAPKVALEGLLALPLRIYLLANGQFITAMPKSIASQSPVKILPVELPVRPWPF